MSPSQTRSLRSRLNGLDRSIARWMREWKVPGLAVGIVHQGRTLLARGYGLRDLRRRLPVGEHTRFAVGSCTKAFTATAVGILVDEKKLDWDTPVRHYIPSFRLHDPAATEHCTLRDLLCHRTGLPRHDLIWEGTPFSRRELFDRLRHLRPSDSFRNRYQYNNLMYMAAGVILEHVAGCTWEDFIRRRITDPLGMTSVSFTAAEMNADDDHALGYDRRPGRTVRVPHENVAPVGPAGAINAHLLDMCKWIAFQMDGGKVGRKRLVSRRTLREIHTPQIAFRETPLYDELLDPSYALGWCVQPYRGRRRLTHAGCMDGYNANTSFLPQDGIGTVVLTNVTGSPLVRLIPYYIFDCLLGLDPADWNRRFRAEERLKRASRPRKARGKTGTRPSHKPADYCGTYEHPAYGRLVISQKRNRLIASHNGFDRPLDHIHYNQFEMVSRGTWPWRKRITFRIGHNGSIPALAANLQDGAPEIVFQRMKPEKKARPAGRKARSISS